MAKFVTNLTKGISQQRQHHSDDDERDDKRP